MPFPFIPTWRAASVTQVSAEFLQQQGIRLLMLDFDNTLVPYTTDVPTEAVKNWLEEMKNSGLTVCIVSNSKNARVPKFCRAYGLNCITRAKKPFSNGIERCLARFSVPAQEAVLVGDQIYTDTLGANAAGVTSILVKAIDNHNFWLKARHVAELPFIFIARKRRIFK